MESVHRGRYVFCDPDGRILDGAGDPEAPFYPRSSLKPFQAMPLILSGAADAFGLEDEEITISCASHHGEKIHVDAVRSLLRKAGSTEEDLDNGAHPPISAPAAEEILRSGFTPGRVHGNCSGKHAGMIAVCRHSGWNPEGYRDPEHPLQVWIREIVSTACSVPDGDIGVGVDGCGAPAFSMPLRSLATGFARLATSEGLPDDMAEAASRIRGAMRGYPVMVSGTEGFDTEVMLGSDLVVKGGADGVWAAGSPDGWGFALKISDGSQRAVRPAVYAALADMGVEMGDPSVTVRDLHGVVAGKLEPTRGEGRG